MAGIEYLNVERTFIHKCEKVFFRRVNYLPRTLSALIRPCLSKSPIHEE